MNNRPLLGMPAFLLALVSMLEKGQMKCLLNAMAFNLKKAALKMV
jgi:hypothetical protein